MTQAITYQRVRGETLIFQCMDPDAAPGDEDTITAKLALLAEGSRALAQTTAAAATLEVDYRAATDDVPEGWTFTLAASDSALLSSNRSYRLDAVRQVGSVKEASVGTVTVRIVEGATP